MKSIRLYLVIILLSSICLINFIAALHGYRNSMEQAETLLDQQLIDTAQLLNQLTENAYQIPSKNIQPNLLYQVWHNGHLLSQSNNAPNYELSNLKSIFHNFNYAGSRWRVFTYQQDNNKIFIARKTNSYNQLIESIILQSVLPIIWVLPLLGLIIWFVVSLGLNPLKRLATLLRQRNTEDLTPLENDGYPNELRDLVESTNNLFYRLNFAFEREKRFAADAAHELRTPLATLNINLHNLTEDINPNNSNYQALKTSIERMGHSIEQILNLYRLNEETLRCESKDIDLKLLLQNIIIEAYQNQSKEHNIEFDAHTIILQADEFALQTLAHNILDNAIKYTPANGNIFIQLKTKNNSAVITVHDSGPGIPTENLSRVFDRFYRLGGDSHKSNVTGCGLGLSIVERIIHLHHGTINLDRSEKLGGLKVCITLPLRQDLA